jgi:hypothetical protein
MLRRSVSIFAYLAVFMPISPAHADELPALFAFMPSFDMPASYTEFSNGINGTAQGWTGYASGTIGLSAPLHSDGWRLKFAGAYANFRYTANHSYCPLSAEEKKQLVGINLVEQCNQIAGDPPEGEEKQDIVDRISPFGLVLNGDQIDFNRVHQATRYHVGIAPGYQLTLGALILRGYLGLAYENETILPDDPTRSIPAESWGAQGWIDAWLQLSENNWLSVDGSYYTGSQSYSAALKLGHVPFSWLSLGPEVAGYGDPEGVSARAGAFVRFDSGQVETTLSGGVSGTYKDDPSLYGGANFYVRF